MNESDVKRKMVRSVRESNGYARRIEDSYGVGILDMIFIPFGLPVMFAEVKIIRGSTFGPSLRQQVELERIKYVSHNTGHAIPMMIGYKDGVYYFHEPAMTIKPEECFSVTTSDMSFHDQLVQYYNSRRK
jgi:hypothetical protein